MQKLYITDNTSLNFFRLIALGLLEFLWLGLVYCVPLTHLSNRRLNHFTMQIGCLFP